VAASPESNLPDFIALQQSFLNSQAERVAVPDFKAIQRSICVRVGVNVYEANWTILLLEKSSLYDF
jgi:hypothetical protein